MRASETEFIRFVSSELEPLAKLSAARLSREEDPLVQAAEFQSENLRVRLENDRGALQLEISPSHARRFWAMDTIARLFPPIRLLSEGNHRLALDEQFQVLREHWRELQASFAVPNYATTAQVLMQGFDGAPKRQ